MRPATAEEIGEENAQWLDPQFVADWERTAKLQEQAEQDEPQSLIEVDRKGKKREKHGTSRKDHGHTQSSMDKLPLDHLEQQMGQVNLQDRADGASSQECQDEGQPALEQVRAWFKDENVIYMSDPIDGRRLRTQRTAWRESSVQWNGEDKACWRLDSEKLGRIFYCFVIENDEPKT